MNEYFNILLEFDHVKFHSKIEEYIINKQKGFVCVIDANVLAIAQKNRAYNKILNDAFVNTCDGGSIATLAGLAHSKKFRALNGPEIFNYYIEKDYKQVLLGSKNETTEKIKNVLADKNLNANNLYSIPLPFLAVDEFDYPSIADEINRIKPDIIWVSLGAPKQEIFMSKIIPHLKQGVLFSIGAAFNFYIGELIVPKFKIKGFTFIWLNRLKNDPKKQLKRIIPYILLIPKLYISERKKAKALKLNGRN